LGSSAQKRLALKTPHVTSRNFTTYRGEGSQACHETFTAAAVAAFTTATPCYSQHLPPALSPSARIPAASRNKAATVSSTCCRADPSRVSAVHVSILSVLHQLNAVACHKYVSPRHLQSPPEKNDTTLAAPSFAAIAQLPAGLSCSPRVMMVSALAATDGPDYSPWGHDAPVDGTVDSSLGLPSSVNRQ
jgi:hypothetical protein